MQAAESRVGGGAGGGRGCSSSSSSETCLYIDLWARGGPAWRAARSLLGHSEPGRNAIRGPSRPNRAPSPFSFSPHLHSSLVHRKEFIKLSSDLVAVDSRKQLRLERDIFETCRSILCEWLGYQPLTNYIPFFPQKSARYRYSNLSIPIYQRVKREKKSTPARIHAKLQFDVQVLGNTFLKAPKKERKIIGRI